MRTYNLASLTKKLYNSKINFFTLRTLKDILEINQSTSLYKIIRKLLDAGVISKIEKNKYFLTDSQINDFALANYIYHPSYISFESALNFYGILSQFPYEITSASLPKTAHKKFQDKIFSYTHLQKDLFWGYEKKDDYLIALPEKALLDQLYLFAKGYKGINLDEYDFSKINLQVLKRYLKQVPKTRQFKRALQSLNQYLKL